MRWFFVLFLALSAVVANAATPAEKISEACRAVLDENMHSMVVEDADALLSTISPEVGSPAQLAQFRREAEDVFETTDVYMRCVGFKLYAVDKMYADAWVIQQTTPKNEDDHHPVVQGKLNFRHNSALLPEHQLVAYKQRFHRQNGKWKLHLVLSEPEPVDEDAVEQLNSAKPVKQKVQPACKNGQCQPFIRVN
jgi:hypothetical protein